MSSAELLKQFDALPAVERKRFLRAMLTRHNASRSPRVRRRAEWPDVAARAGCITGGQVGPNLVLQARDEAAY